MSNLRPVDPDTGFLMPPSVDEWLPQKHLARFVVVVIGGLDLRAMIGSYRGSGGASYHRTILLGILIHGYASGVFSQGNRVKDRVRNRQRFKSMHLLDSWCGEQAWTARQRAARVSTRPLSF